MAKLLCRNPATGELIRELETTPTEALPLIFEKAQKAQKAWALRSLKDRASVLLDIRETMINQADALVETLVTENGKPRVEALANEIFTCIDMATFFAARGPKALRDRSISLRLMRHRKSYLNYWPLGVVLVISPWNYPLMLPFGDILMALMAGNAVVFKPSEITPLVGLKIQDVLDRAGVPDGLVQTVIGDGALGAALIQQKPSKIFFTGSVPTGKKVLRAAAEHLIPVNLELGGKDPMIIMADADLDFASSAALWGSFSNSGQVCASTERILVHESIRDPFLKAIGDKIAQLRQGPPSFTQDNTDLGAITMEKQKDTYDAHLGQARDRGAEIVSGGVFSEDRRFLKPTVVAGPGIESLSVYNEETFGPVVAVTTFKSTQEAVEKANHSPYGLLASVISRDVSLAEKTARQIEAGSVLINEVTYSGGLGETPWGGVKESGMGRTHSEAGLLEFVNVRHIHKPRMGFTFLKAPWWFPYTPYQYATFRSCIELYRKSWLSKLRALPHLIWNFVQMLKNEKRL
jgi:acyl-CoA reductase-like NAD-dependent aldehyde dehydrogenase